MTITEYARPSKTQRAVMHQIADRTDHRSPDPGVTTSGPTFADSYNVFVHWRTADALYRRGLIEYPFKGGPDEGWSIALTDAGWAAIQRTRPADMRITRPGEDT